jgi:predicted enzyme related to lactoylglutathione lyase
LESNPLSESNQPEIGAVGWRDLTVEDAEAIRDFYGEVVGWRHTPHPMPGYSDFNMIAPATGNTVAGICHARGMNANLPAQWLIYITVEDVDQSAARCLELGGKVIDGPKDLGPNARCCVIQDPAGAVAALYSTKAAESD